MIFISIFKNLSSLNIVLIYKFRKIHNNNWLCIKSHKTHKVSPNDKEQWNVLWIYNDIVANYLGFLVQQVYFPPEDDHIIPELLSMCSIFHTYRCFVGCLSMTFHVGSCFIC